MSYWIPTYSASEWLEIAGAELTRGALHGAQWTLTSAWVELRDPGLARMIERISDHLADAEPPLSGSTKELRDQQWRRRMRSRVPEEQGLLLRSLGDTDSIEGCHRLGLIAEMAPDPRLADALCSLLLDPPFADDSAAQFWPRVHALLLECADPRSLTRLEQASPATSKTSMTGLDGWRRRCVEDLRERLETIDTEPTPAQRRRIRSLDGALERALSGELQREPQLLEAVLDDPKDLDRRQVYADSLIERGDPRGEFIALQLADTRAALDRTGKARMRELQSQGQCAWVGPLDLILIRSGRVFTAGFLSTARIRLDAHPTDMHVGHRVWTTLEVLEHAPCDLLMHPVMRSLRAIAWVPWQLGQAVHRRARLPTVEHLGINISSWRGNYFGPNSERIVLRPAIESPAMFPALQSLAVRVQTALTLDQIEWLWSGAVGRRLRSLEIRGGAQLGLVACADSLMRASAAKLERVDIHAKSLHARFVRSQGAWSRVELSASRRTPAAAIVRELRGLARIRGLEVGLSRSLASREEPELRAAMDACVSRG